MQSGAGQTGSTRTQRKVLWERAEVEGEGKGQEAAGGQGSHLSRGRWGTDVKAGKEQGCRCPEETPDRSKCNHLRPHAAVGRRPEARVAGAD